jgi:hypothetical protein
MSVDRYAKQRIFSVPPAAIREASTSGHPPLT